MGKLNKRWFFIIATVLIVFYFVNSKVGYQVNGANKNNETVFGRGFTNTDPANLGKVADPNYKIHFPQDHYSHDAFDIEWWYLTANLQDDAGNDYGVQWTLFRFRNPNFNNDQKASSAHWNNEHLYMAHASVHSQNEHWFSEKFARGNVGNAGVDQSPFQLFIDDWHWLSPNEDLLPAQLRFNANLISGKTKGSRLSLQLNLTHNGDYVLQGQDGYSIKSADGKHASHYYSAPFINIEGKLSTGVNEKQTHIAVKGRAWFDQEWTSQLFDQATLGWDWLSLHLDNGDKIMAFRMRLKGQEDYITGTYISADGLAMTLSPSDISLKPLELTEIGTKNLPLSWQLKINNKGVDIKIKTTKDDQWNPASVSYYEGTVDVSGTHQGKGFLELTGY